MSSLATESYEVFLVSLPTLETLTTSIDAAPSAERELVFVKATSPDGNVGWGECSALNSAGYTPEWARGAFGLLAAGTPVNPSVYPMAYAGIEMAKHDLQLKGQGISLAAHLGASRSHVPAGVVVGLLPIPQLMAKVDELIDAGYQRLKLKIAPGEIAQRVTSVRERYGQVEIQVDANGSLGEADFDDLAALKDANLSAVEQPFGSDDVVLTAKLQQLLGVRVFADEAIRNPAELAARNHYDGLVVKPGPSGGVAETLKLVSAATDQGWALSAGGMLESGLGRHALAAWAANEAFTHTGDISPARRWLRHDPWPDLTMADGQIAVPSLPGVAPEPDEELLDRFSLARGRVLRR